MNKNKMFSDGWGILATKHSETPDARFANAETSINVKADGVTFGSAFKNCRTHKDMKNHILSMAFQERNEWSRYGDVEKCLISALKLLNKE
ncbi:hypothetical protein ANTPLA_LOCUS10932 [Anthophora plagiata]